MDWVRMNNDYIRFSLDEFKHMSFGSLLNDRIDNKFNMLITNILIYYQTNRKTNIVIDNFPLDMNSIKLILSTASEIEIKQFDVTFKEALVRNNVRRKLGGHYVLPTEMKRYEETYEQFINSEEYLKYTMKNNVSVIADTFVNTNLSLVY